MDKGNNKKKIAVIGYGYVGQSVADFFKEKFSVFVHDPAKFIDERYDDALGLTTGASLKAVSSCDLAIVCVPTPMSKNGSVDTSIVAGVVGSIKTPLIMIRSTVPPGTTDLLGKKSGKRIIFSPELIGEGKYPVPYWKDYPHPTDMRYHTFSIFGGKRADTSAALQFFKTVAGAEMRYIQTDSRTAELFKYTDNAFLATKVTFVNELYDISKAFGVDYDELREIWLLDGRVGRSHTAVHPDARGFGGKCLPKDVTGLVKAAEDAGFEPKLLKAVLSTNEQFRKNQKKS
jgi:UDPglucose 6-dehydrogenase